MPYDFLDPQQENEYLTKAKAQGIPMGEAIAVANNFKKQQLSRSQVGLDVQKQQIESMKIQRDLLELSSKPSTGLPKMNEFETKVINAKIAADKALSFLEGGVSTGPLASRVSKVKEMLGSPDEGTDYRASLNLATSQLFNALAGSAQSDTELKRLSALMPTDTDQEETAKRKLKMLTTMLEEQSAARGVDISSLGKKEQMTAPGMGIPPQKTTSGIGVDQLTSSAPTKPAINVYGEIAKTGDLVYNDRTGSFAKYGSSEQGKVFKKSSEGSTIENPLIKFLADSEFLPIAGSIVGGLMGAGLASIGTGAAGAVAGKTMQQGLRELFDPERQELSDMAKAVVTEGVTDALIGGAMFGVGKAVMKGGKMVMTLGNAAKAGSQVAEAGIKEGVQAGAKEGFVSQVIKDDIMAQFKPSKTIRKEALGRNIDLAESIIKGGFGDDAAENLAKTQQNLAQRGEEFRSIIGSANTTVNSHSIVDDVAQDMMKTARSQSQEKAIGEWAGFLKAKKLTTADDLMTAYAQKIEAGQSGYKDAGDVVQNFIGQADAKLERKLRESILSSLDGQAKTQAENILRSQETDIFLGKMFEDAMLSDKPLSISERIGRITNPMTAVKETVGKVAETGVRRARSSQVFNAVGKAAQDLPENTKMVMGSIIDKLPVESIKQPKGLFGALNDVLGTKNSTLPTAIVSAVRDLPEEAQAEFFNQAIKFNAQAQNKIGMRNTIRLAFRLGVTFTANNIPDGEQKQSPTTVPQGVPSGMVSQAPGMDLGAFSPEGAPLYR